MTIKKGTTTIATDSSSEWGNIDGTLSNQVDLQTALNAKAPSLNPAFTGIPTAPTAAEGTNTSQIATTEYVQTELSNIDSLPDQTDQSGKCLMTDGIDAYWKSPAGFPLFSFIWADHILNDASFLRADTFSWQNGHFYKSAYEHLVEDLGEQELTTYYAWTISSQYYLFTLSPTPSEGDILYNGSGSYYPTYTDDPGDLRYGIFTPTTNTVYRTDGSTYIRDYDGENDWDRSSGFDTPIPKYPNQHSETIAGIQITYYQAPDGHKIVLPDQESNVEAIYNATGVAWYYILDIENHRFKLPRTKFGFTGLRDYVGKYVPAGLPNITGTVYGGNHTLKVGFGNYQGAFYSSGTYKGASTSGDSGDIWDGELSFDASRSNSIYGNSSTVQPPATQMYLYFYVGDTVRTETEIDIGELTEALNDKLDTNLNNATSTTKKTIVGWGMPDYSRGISIPVPKSSAPYTAPYNGFYKLGYENSSALDYKYLTVNGSRVYRYQYSGGANPGWSCSVELKKGDILSSDVNSTPSTVLYSVFYPCIGD